MKAEERKELQDAYQAIQKAIGHIGYIEDEIEGHEADTMSITESLHDALFEIVELMKGKK